MSAKKEGPYGKVFYLKVFYSIVLGLFFFYLLCSAGFAFDSEKTDISFDISHPAEEELRISCPEVFLEGKIHAQNGIRRIELNGQDLLNVDEIEAAVEKNWQKLGKKLIKQNQDPKKFRQILKSNMQRYNLYYLNHIYPLKEGLNKLDLLVEDNLGNKASKRITFQKIPPDKIFKSKDRMILALVPFAKEKEDKIDIQGYVYNRLIESFSRQARFNLVEREKLPWLLIEKAVRTKEISREDIAGQIGQITPAEGVIFVEVQKVNDGIEILGRLVDVESSATLLLHRVFTPIKDLKGNKDYEDLNIIICGLAMKFRHSFPLGAGTIMAKDGRTLQVNLGSEEGIFPGMRYNIYINEQEVISRALIKDVAEGSSVALIPEGEKSWRIKVGYRVSTR